MASKVGSWFFTQKGDNDALPSPTNVDGVILGITLSGVVVGIASSILSATASIKANTTNSTGGWSPETIQDLNIAAAATSIVSTALLSSILAIVKQYFKLDPKK